MIWDIYWKAQEFAPWSPIALWVGS